MKFSIFFAAALTLLVGGASASTLERRLAANPVDACNGSNEYGVGHSCAWNNGGSTAEGTCQNNACGNLVCQ